MTERSRVQRWARALLRPDLALFVASCVIFLAWPDLDLIAARLFYDPGTGFYLGQTPVVQGIYHATEPIALAVLFGAVTIWVATYFRATPRRRHFRRIAAYVVVAGLLGPVVLVNSVIKEYSGRARPSEVQQFGGKDTFTPALTVAHQCRSNCSFTSGHAAAGFYLMVLAWALGRPALLAVGIAAGTVVGIARMAEGDHFLSDVVFSFWAVYFVCALLALWFSVPGLAPRRRASSVDDDSQGPTG